MAAQIWISLRHIGWRPRSSYDEADKFAAWLRTTWLPYTQRVPENLREEFIAAVTQRYLANHPPDAEGRVHVRMMRLEIDAVKLWPRNSRTTRKVAVSALCADADEPRTRRYHASVFRVISRL